MNVNVLT